MKTEEGCILIPKRFVTEVMPDLSAGEIRVFVSLCAMVSNVLEPFIEISVSQIGKSTGLTSRTVFVIIDKLEVAGLIARTRQDMNSSNCYEIPALRPPELRLSEREGIDAEDVLDRCDFAHPQLEKPIDHLESQIDLVAKTCSEPISDISELIADCGGDLDLLRRCLECIRDQGGVDSVELLRVLTWDLIKNPEVAFRFGFGK